MGIALPAGSPARTPRAAVSWVTDFLRAKKKLWPIRRELIGTPAFGQVIKRGSLELASIAPQCFGSTLIVEVGSNAGQDTARMLDVFPSARVLCFEPDSRAARAWRENVSNQRATLFEIAISDFSGTVVFHESDGIPPSVNPEEFPEGWHLSGSILPPKDHTEVHTWSRFDHKVEVPCQTLDAALKRELSEETSDFPIGLVWADVQGAEEQLVRGASQTLARTRFLYTEFGTRELYEGQVSLRGLLRLLPDFRVKTIWTNDVLLENRSFAKSTRGGSFGKSPQI